MNRSDGNMTMLRLMAVEMKVAEAADAVRARACRRVIYIVGAVHRRCKLSTSVTLSSQDVICRAQVRRIDSPSMPAV